MRIVVDYNEVCDNILRIDSKIRYVGIYHQGEFHSKTRKGLKSLLTEDEVKNSAIQAIRRWETRLALTDKLGNSIYSLTKYEKVNRITIPIGEDGLILFSTETDLDPNLITDKIIKFNDIQVLLLSDGASATCPSLISPRKPFFLEVGWLTSENNRQRLIRNYNDRGEWLSSTLVKEVRI